MPSMVGKELEWGTLVETTTINLVGTFNCIIITKSIISANNSSYDTYQHYVFPHNIILVQLSLGQIQLNIRPPVSHLSNLVSPLRL